MHSKLFMLAALFVLCVTGCTREAEEDKEEEIAPLKDAFSGKTVRNAEDAEGLVMSRLVNAPVAGENAPGGTVYDPVSEKPMKLKELWRKKPAVLVFGSGSCPALNIYEDDLKRLTEIYGKRMNFKMIYIREAHPVGGFRQELENDYAAVDIPLINDSRTLRDRCNWARDFQSRREFGMSFLVDDVDDSIAAQWSAWPVRVFVVSTEGIVIYAGDQGPWYFSVNKERWHKPPTQELDEVFKKRPYNRESLEEFLEQYFNSRRPT